MRRLGARTPRPFSPLARPIPSISTRPRTVNIDPSTLPPGLPPIEPFALLDDCHATRAAPTSRLYTMLVREHCCNDPTALETVWSAVDADLRAGFHAVVLADYEWGARLLGAGHERLSAADAGSLRVLMFAHMQRLDADAASAWLAARERACASSAAGGACEPTEASQVFKPSEPEPAGVLDLRASVDRAAFDAAIVRIHHAIEVGETYQVNYSYRLDFRSFGLPLSLYRRLRAHQPVAFGALIALPRGDAGPDWVLSCSPELFLRNTGGRLTARPMKGTAARAQDPGEDAEIARGLAADAKNRAENLMIVDLLRNDLGRVARTGSVRVPALFSVETYPTVLQMTSTVEAELPTGTGFPALLRALFPCGSITGAPKHRTMQWIAALEDSPRGLYTGSIGWIDAPVAGSACGDFCLSVAIRTLSLRSRADGAGCDGRMGVGAGIVIDSRAADEYAECRLKARFLTALDPGFVLFETMHATREAGVRHLDRHLGRLEASAVALDFGFSRERIVAGLEQAVAALPSGAEHRLRLALHKDGRFELAAAVLDPLPPGPVEVLLARTPIDDPFGLLGHKTTLRSRYDEGIRAAQARGAFDMLFFDGEGWLTEGGRSNVFLRVEGQWLTPPLGRGVLPGTMRAALLADPAWSARERRLRVGDLLRAERIVLTNALRGVLEARLAPGEAERGCLGPVLPSARR